MSGDLSLNKTQALKVFQKEEDSMAVMKIDKKIITTSAFFFLNQEFSVIYSSATEHYTGWEAFFPVYNYNF